MKKYKVAIVGATGAVGREMLRCIFQFNFPFESLKLLASARSAGKVIEFEGQEFVVEELTENSFEGVERSFAIQAGREVRIMVKADKVSDDDTILMAKDIVKRIEETMEYPGQIKVNVIRELRAIEYAK